MKKLTFGLIIGNREFFPDKVVEEGRKRIMEVIEKSGYNIIVLSPSDTKLGAVENLKDAQKCAKLFKENAEKIDGIIVTLPNFGDEKAIASAIRISELNVPVLIHAFPDEPEKLDLANRRDAFCGKISVCNNLKQFGIKFTLTTFHTEAPESEIFKKDLEKFASICRILKGMKNLKIGAVGTRPTAFNTMRFSEKILERYGISTETIDLSELIYEMEKIPKTVLKEKIATFKKNFKINVVPEEKLTKMVELWIALEKWVKENEIRALAIQCWTSIEKNLGIAPCAVMSLLSENLIPAACEVDVMGALSMYILQLASEKPSALVDWNNNYKDEDEVILFHCGNFPISMYDEEVEMRYGDVIGTVVGFENTYGSCTGRIKPSFFTFLRITTDDEKGEMKAYTGEGEIIREDAKTFGSRGIARVKGLQKLMRFICENGFEHHVAINLSKVASSIKEALENYLGIETYYHSAE